MAVYIELLLILFYTLLCLWGIRNWSFFSESGISFGWLSTLFIIKLGVGFLLYLVYTQFYTIRSEADIFKYFDDSLVVYNGLFIAPKDYFQLVFFKAPDTAYFYDNYYLKMNHWANLHNSIFYGDSILMIKINAFFRLFSFGSFHVHAVFFNFLSFIGLVGIFRWFKPYISNNINWLVLVVFCMPSVLFWSSSVLKESLLLLLLGVISFQFQQLKAANSLKLNPFVYLFIAIFFLALLKFYIVVALLIPLTAYLIVRYSQLKSALFVYSLTFIVFLVVFFNSNLVDVLVLKQHDFISLVSNTKAGSYFQIPLIEPTFISIIKAIPNGFLNCFIQPVPTSKLSIMALPAILENILILLGLVFIIPQVFRKKNWKGKQFNELLFIVFFTVILFAIIGVTTPVAGALVRYKVGALPFLGIFILYFIQLKFKKNEQK